jgi:hypothetical protein
MIHTIGQPTNLSKIKLRGILILLSSSSLMLCLWTGGIVMGAAYLLGLWDGQGSPAFIVGQIVLSVIGVLRELHLRKNGFKLN